MKDYLRANGVPDAFTGWINTGSIADVSPDGRILVGRGAAPAGNLLYHFGNRETKLRPFVFGGMGTTFFSADDLESETKFSFGLGGGVKYFPWKSIGARASFRYTPTMLNDDETVAFCDPFGFCQGSLQQIDIAAGAVVRF